MTENKVVAFQRPDGIEDPLTELLRRGWCRRMGAAHARWMRRFPGCTCTGFPPAT